MKFTEEEMEAYFYGPTPEDWPMKCAAMFEQMRAERDALREELSRRMIERDAMLEELGCK